MLSHLSRHSNVATYHTAVVIISRQTLPKKTWLWMGNLRAEFQAETKYPVFKPVTEYWLQTANKTSFTCAYDTNTNLWFRTKVFFSQDSLLREQLQESINLLFFLPLSRVFQRNSVIYKVNNFQMSLTFFCFIFFCRKACEHNTEASRCDKFTRYM